MLITLKSDPSESLRQLLLFLLAARDGFEGVERFGNTDALVLEQDDATNLRLVVNLRVHLRAGEGEQTHPVSLPQQILLAISHVQGLFLHHLSGDEGGSGESQCLFQSAVWEGEKRFLVTFEVPAVFSRLSI